MLFLGIQTNVFKLCGCYGRGKLEVVERVLVSCQDGKERLCRIRGKLKRRVWIRLGDIVLVSPWDFQSDKRGDIIWRYKRNQAEWLRRNGYVKI